jgi:hypothetical protein
VDGHSSFSSSFFQCTKIKKKKEEEGREEEKKEKKNV